MRIKIYKILFIVLIILALITIVLIGNKYLKSYLTEKENQNIVETFSREVEINNDDTCRETQTTEVLMNGYKVIGIVNIPKIKIEYPILDIDTYNPEETKEPMKISIVKYWGVNVNEKGNLSIAGHNNYNGTMFGKTKYLNNGDIIELTDLNNVTIQYIIYDIFVTDPNDISILQTNDNNVREVTLITCTNGNRKRLILKAKEIL